MLIHRVTLPYLMLTVGSILGACRDPVDPNSGALGPVSYVEAASALGKWTSKAPLPAPGYGISGGVVTNGAGHTIFYVIGGIAVGRDPRRVDAYNPVTNSWTHRAPLPEGRMGTNGTGTINGKLYLAGGLNPPCEHCTQTYRRTLYVYDPAANSWSRKARMPFASAEGVTGVIGGKLYVFTGNGHRLYRYTPASNTWTRLADCPAGHEGGAGGVIDNKLYVVGGHGIQGGLSRRLHVYNPATNTWASRAGLPTARSAMTAAVFKSKLYVIGGFELHDGNSVDVGTVNTYDPATNTWSTKASMGTPRHSLAAGTVKTAAGQLRIHAVGGYSYLTSGVNGLTTNEMYTP